jgi:CHASE2 domain-containing sensor protein
MMLPYKSREVQRRRWFIGGAVIAIIGVALTALPLGKPLATLSYDLPYLFRGTIDNTNIVVILEDAKSLDAMGYKTWPPPRTVHAQLLDRLHDEGAGLVVFDIAFSVERPEDDVFAAAIRRHTNVIVGCVPKRTSHQVGNDPGAEQLTFAVTPKLQSAAAGSGLLLATDLDSSFRVRRMLTSWEGHETVAWVAAKKSGMIDTGSPEERWINFYGPPPVFDRMALGELLDPNQRPAPGLLRGKVIFVGVAPTITSPNEQGDTISTPYTRFGKPFTPGVEVLANIYANLMAKDWLRELSLPVQCALSVMIGLGALALLIWARSHRVFLLAFALVLLVMASGIIAQWRFGVWFNWLVPAVILIPAAAILAVLCPRLPMIAFISYRRTGGDKFALAVLHAMRAHGHDAFLDVKDLPVGEKWPPQLREGIDRTKNFILILSPGALDERPAGNPDWMRDEILYAIKRKRKIIPIRLDGFNYPSPLPIGMESLPHIHDIIHDHRKWDVAMEELEKNLDR